MIELYFAVICLQRIFSKKYLSILSELSDSMLVVVW